MASNKKENDPLLACLRTLCRLRQQPFSRSQALAGLPLADDGRLDPPLFIRAAKQCHLKAALLDMPLETLDTQSLPLILLLNEDNACVIQKKVGEDQYQVKLPGEKSTTWTRDTLAEHYAGFAITATTREQHEERAEELHQTPTTSWFWHNVFRYKRIFAHVFIATLLTNLFVLVAPIYIMNVYDRVLPTHATATLWVLTIGAALFFCFDFLSRFLRTYLLDSAGRKADNRLASELFKHLLHLKVLHRPGSAGAFAHYFAEFEVLRNFYTSAAIVGLIDMPFTILFLLAIYLIAGPLVLVPLIAIPIVVIVAILLEIPTRNAVHKALSGATEKEAILIESITGLEAIKTLNAEGMMQRKWEEAISKQGEAGSASKFYSNIAANFTVWSQQLVTISVIVYGVYLIHINALTIGALVATTILTGRVMMLGQLVSLAICFSRSRAALDALNKMMKLPSEREADSHYLHRPLLKGRIECSDLSFLYPKRRIPALNKINMSIQPGERVAIVGRIGSGKSTLLKLLIGLYQATGGHLMVDGTDNREIDPTDLRDNIHYVSTDSILFYGTVRDNIAMGDPNADDEEIIKAAQLTGVDAFVKQSPLGYDMPVGERGAALSDGQRQAVALARALLGKPNVICLDEPTATLDSSYELELIKKLPAYIEGKTLILVTHKPAMLELVDRIIVFEAGKIVADGPRDDILKAIKTQLKNANEDKS